MGMHAPPPFGAKDLLCALLRSAQCGHGSSLLQLCQVGPSQPANELELL